MVQVLCYTDHGFDTCWRPASVATNQCELGNHYSGPWSAVRFIR